MKEMLIVGCKRISLRKHPWITTETDEIVGEFKVSEIPIIMAADQSHEENWIWDPFNFRHGMIGFDRSLVGPCYVDMREGSLVYDWKDNSFCPMRINGVVGYLNTKHLKEKIQND